MAVDFFERELMLATADLQPEAINKALAEFAREQLRDVIAKGQAPAIYERYVNGKAGLSEDMVKAPGPIIYDFVNWSLVIRATIGDLKKRVPVKSGRYQGSFVVIVNGALVEDYKTIPADATVIVFNTQPYTRKMENGVIGGRGEYHFRRTRDALEKRTPFRSVFSFETKYMNRNDVAISGVPYILKRDGGRKDRRAGMAITYPSIIIKAL